jgi:hypothetical protein
VVGGSVRACRSPIGAMARSFLQTEPLRRPRWHGARTPHSVKKMVPMLAAVCSPSETPPWCCMGSRDRARVENSSDLPLHHRDAAQPGFVQRNKRSK